MSNFINNTKYERVRKNTAPGTALITTDVVDVDSAKSITFMIEMGAVSTGNIKIQLQGSHSEAPTSMVNLNKSIEVPLTAITDNHKLIAFEYNAPMFPFLQLEISRTGNQGLDSILCFKHEPRFKPVHNSDSFLVFLAEPN